MAEQVPASALNRRSGEVLDRVMRGETLELTRHGKVVAILKPPKDREAEPEAKQPDEERAPDPIETRRRAAKEQQELRDRLLRGAR